VNLKRGVEVVDVFNDLDKNRNGRYQLSNLVIGNSIEVLRLKVPAITQATNFCFFRLGTIPISNSGKSNG